MAPDQITRCPHCQAVFRVTPEQLAQAKGWLRCGHCREVFDSTGLWVLWQPEADGAPPRMDLRDFLEKEDLGAPASNDVSDALRSFEQALATFPGRPEPALESLDATVALDHGAQLHSPVASAPVRSRWPWIGVLSLLLLLLLQSVWAARAVWWQTPWIAASAQSLCAHMGCVWPASREPGQLLIDSSRLLRSDEGYRLEWALRNRSLWPVHMPSMELVLTDPSDTALVRRVVPPAVMMAPERLAPGQLWEGALKVQVEEGLGISGYRLRVFYP